MVDPLSFIKVLMLIGIMDYGEMMSQDVKIVSVKECNEFAAYAAVKNTEWSYVWPNDEHFIIVRCRPLLEDKET